MYISQKVVLTGLTSTQIKEKCPSCGHDEMQYHTLQLRSADEGVSFTYGTPSRPDLTFPRLLCFTLAQSVTTSSALITNRIMTFYYDILYARIAQSKGIDLLTKNPMQPR